MTIAPFAPSPVMRTCEDCTLCCKVMGIVELNKPSGEWCPNCNIGQGCAIYGSHPGSCQGFLCEWLRNPDVPENFRPNEVHIVFTTLMFRDGARLIANCDQDNPTAWRDQPVYGWLKERAARSWQRGGFIMARVIHHTWLIGPNGDLDVGLIVDDADLIMEQRNDGTYAVRQRI